MTRPSRCIVQLASDKGVVRLYAMTLDAVNWTFTREAPDFSPLDFTQRFAATVDGDEIRGEWQTGEGDGWSRDFARVSAPLTRAKAHRDVWPKTVT